MKLTNSQIYEVIKIVVTAIFSIAATLFVQSCTVSLSVAKNNQNASQGTSQTVQIDSLSTHFSNN